LDTGGRGFTFQEVQTMNKALLGQPTVEDDRTGLSVETLRRAFADNLYYIQGKFPEIATKNDYYMALSYTIRDRLLQRWISTVQAYLKKDVRVVAYMSAEYLLGPHLGNAMINLGIYSKVKEAAEEAGLNLEELIDLEEEPGLGNGGLGRLAACYMDSLATLEIPAIGYGIRYEFGIFDQIFRDGWQIEITDKWLHYGNPWEIRRAEYATPVKLGGHTESYTDEKGRFRVRWVPHRVINGIPYDTPIVGYQTNTTNTLRLWKAEATESFDFKAFNTGDYIGAVTEKMFSENITKVLYPNDESWQGKELRLEQEYFFVSCSLQDMIRMLLREGHSLEDFPKKFAVQLNDTHPAIGIAELMRLLVDDHCMAWEKAWDITQKTFAYTNHTLLPEALEKWRIDLFGGLLPRHLEIIFEINRRFLDDVKAKYPDDNPLLASLSLVDETGERSVRMANLACVGSHAINGVAALHTELLKQGVLKDFHLISPEKFSNKTNGVTPRRWLVLSNPRLKDLIEGKIGDSWIKDLYKLRQLEEFIDDEKFRKQWRATKQAVKSDLAQYIRENLGIAVLVDSIFDVQVKRIHEYKRQHLNVLHIISLYNRIKRNPRAKIAPRTFIFGGKAAPGYFMAKVIIKLINSVAQVINNDPEVLGLIKVIFLPDYNVKLAQRIYPAADLSEQISTAGKEASGTGNMKLSINGALTIGTLDGANIEIRQEVGKENFFLFGLDAEEVVSTKAKGYRPNQYYHANPELQEVLDQISSGYFSQGNPDLFRPLVESLLYRDDFMLLADFQSYVECQKQVDLAFQNEDKWTRMSILNAARMGKFSSDRAIREYCQDIWNTQPVKVDLKQYVQSEAGLKVL
jgi:starch phosphorylase